MARPAKSAATNARKIGKAEKSARKAAENCIKGATLPEPPEDLTARQAEIFQFIVEGLKDSQILGKLDTYVLRNTAVAIERLENLDALLQQPENVGNSKLMAARKVYSSDLFRGCNELCLSPQARAKIAIAQVNALTDAKKKNPLLEALDD